MTKTKPKSKKAPAKAKTKTKTKTKTKPKPKAKPTAKAKAPAKPKAAKQKDAKPQSGARPAERTAKLTPAKARAASPRTVVAAKQRPAPAAAVEIPSAPTPTVAAPLAPSPAAVATAVPDTSADADGKAAVDAFLEQCTHPLKDAYAAARQLILGVSSSITEGIRWNAPSFRTTDWFATFFLRDPSCLKIVFHLGAKKRTSSNRVPVGAPEGMVEWLAPDRCMVTLADAAAVQKRAKAFQAFVRAWILQV